MVRTKLIAKPIAESRPCRDVFGFSFVLGMPRYEDVKQYEEKAPYGKMAHPRPDHFYPLHVALGAAGEESKAELIHNSWTRGTLSYASYRFTSKN